MKTAYLYAGQGSQHEGMGKDLYEKYPVFRRTIDEAAIHLLRAGARKTDLRDLMFTGTAEELTRTENTQVCLAAFAAGVSEVLRDRGFVPDYAAGLSLGEYSALYEAQVLDLECLMKVTDFRGRVMEEAGKGLRVSMCAILGLEADAVDEICRVVSPEGDVRIANYNARGQNVIAGDAAKVEQAAKAALQRGARRCMRLKVSSAFHTKYMESARIKLAGFLRQIPLNPMELPVIFNVTGSPLQGEEQDEQIRALLADQVVTGVRMAQTIIWLKAQGVEKIIEIGPGNVLAGFVKRTVEGVEVFSIDQAQDMEIALERSRQWKEKA